MVLPCISPVEIGGASVHAMPGECSKSCCWHLGQRGNRSYGPSQTVVWQLGETSTRSALRAHDCACPHTFAEAGRGGRPCWVTPEREAADLDDSASKVAED
eukprot:scaffold271572_cov32-Tisochrysis_lutea.AAC.2